MLTTETIQLEYNKLNDSINFHVHNETLRAEALKFIATIQNRLVTAPASSQGSHHHAYAGGLLKHINENIRHGLTTLESDLVFAGLAGSLKQASEDLVLVALLHDIHKIGDPFGRLYYEPHMIKASRKKDETQMVQSTAKPYEINGNAYKIAMSANFKDPGMPLAVATMLDRNLDRLPAGELSLMLVHALQPSFYAILNDEVKFSVRYHDGAYQGGAAYAMAGKESPVMLAHHHADMLSSRVSKWQQPATTQTDE